MSTGSESLPPLPEATGDAGVLALVAALDSAPAAIYCLAGVDAAPVWANERARTIARSLRDLPPIDGRPVLDVVAAVLRTGRPETVSGVLGNDGPSTSAAVRPVPLPDGPGVLLIIQSDEAPSETSLWPEPGDDVEQAQLSLLPPSLPFLPDLRLSGSYHRATSARAAGGDWYDAVPLGAGRVALVVGDAVGHGVPAAGAMSRLRGAMRSSALRDPAPEVVMAALDAFAAQMEDVEGASVFYGLLEADNGRLTYAAAGHPAPLVVTAGGETSFLPLTPRPPLGSLPGTATAVAEHVLDHGSTLVLFSNGAVAGIDPAPGQALAHLADVARTVLQVPGALAADASAGLAAAVAEGVPRPDGRPDDVAVLVAHRLEASPEPFRVDVQALPAALPGIRRRLGAWLSALGMGEQDRVGVMVAVGEACANAAEHAYRGSEAGPMTVTAQVDVDGVLTVTVRDEGTWRPPDRDPGDRGRGLLIMRQLVDDVVLDERERGTTVTLGLRLRHSPDLDVERDPSAGGASVLVDREGVSPVVSVSGVVDELSAEQLRIRLLEASHGGTIRVELDLTAVSLFSSAAVRVVLAIARIGRGEGWRLVVHAPAGGVTRHILQISGLADLVELR